MDNLSPVPQFGDTVAPLYANVKPWIDDAIGHAHPDQDVSSNDGIVDFVKQLDGASRHEIEKDFEPPNRRFGC